VVERISTAALTPQVVSLLRFPCWIGTVAHPGAFESSEKDFRYCSSGPILPLYSSNGLSVLALFSSLRVGFQQIQDCILRTIAPLSSRTGAAVPTIPPIIDINRCLTYPHGPTTHPNLLLVNGHEETHASNRSSKERRRARHRTLTVGPTGQTHHPHTHARQPNKKGKTCTGGCREENNLLNEGIQDH
jgi:hypothetical protein